MLQDVANRTDADAPVAAILDGDAPASYTPAAAEHFEKLLKASVAQAATMLDASVAALRRCDNPGDDGDGGDGGMTRRAVREVFGGAAACAPLARNLTLLRAGCLDHLRLVLDLRAAGGDAEEPVRAIVEHTEHCIR